MGAIPCTRPDQLFPGHYTSGFRKSFGRSQVTETNEPLSILPDVGGERAYFAESAAFIEPNGFRVRSRDRQADSLRSMQPQRGYGLAQEFVAEPSPLGGRGYAELRNVADFIGDETRQRNPCERAVGEVVSHE